VPSKSIITYEPSIFPGIHGSQGSDDGDVREDHAILEVRAAQTKFKAE
jgi:hypothetical protein